GRIERVVERRLDRLGGERLAVVELDALAQRDTPRRVVDDLVARGQHRHRLEGLGITVEQPVVDVLEHVVGRPVHDRHRQHRPRLGAEADHDLLALDPVLGERGSGEGDDDENDGDGAEEGAHKASVKREASDRGCRGASRRAGSRQAPSVPAPPTTSAATAWTKSRSFTASTPPRTTRAYTTHPAAERLRMMLRRPRPTIALIVMARRMNGNESCTSARRMSAADGQRSTKPAIRPSRPPTTAVTTTVQAPMNSASRAP